MSGKYNTWVLWGRLTVHNSGVGWSTYTHPFPTDRRQFRPVTFPRWFQKWRRAPYLVWLVLPITIFSGIIESCPRNIITLSLGRTLSSYPRKLMMINKRAKNFKNCVFSLVAVLIMQRTRRLPPATSAWVVWNAKWEWEYYEPRLNRI